MRSRQESLIRSILLAPVDFSSNKGHIEAKTTVWNVKYTPMSAHRSLFCNTTLPRDDPRENPTEGVGIRYYHTAAIALVGFLFGFLFARHGQSS